MKHGLRNRLLPVFSATRRAHHTQVKYAILFVNPVDSLLELTPCRNPNSLPEGQPPA